MSDITSVIETNSADLQKIQDHLETISASLANESELSAILSSATTEFNKFFLNYGKPYFTAHKFHRHDSPQSSVYNQNINSLDEDLTRLYTMASSVSTLTLKSFNFSTIVANELITSAQIAASKVLDLSIIGGFVKGKVFVAGDDFTSNDFIDTSVGINTSQAEILKGGAAMALKRVGSVQVTSPNNEITITQVAPQNTTSDPNNPHPPTPGNLERFYEGKFYAYIGEIEPEGGFLDIQYIVDPANIITSGSSTTADGQTDDSDAFDAYTSALDAGFYAIMPPTEEAKKIIRHRMLDGQPDTYWQCEYVYETPSLLPGGGGASSPISSASLVE